MHQKGFAQILILFFLLGGIAVGTYLVQQKTNLFSKAAEINQQSSPKLESDFSYTQPLNISVPIYTFSIDGDVSFKNNNSYLRVILVDSNKNEFLIYEGFPLITDKNTVSFRGACEETCILDGITPNFLRIEGNSATINISKTSFSDKRTMSPQSIKEQSDSIKSQKEKEKISKLNQEIKARGLRWTAGETPVSKMTYAQKLKLFTTKEGKPVDHLPNLQGFEYYKGGIFEIIDSSRKISASTNQTPASARVFVTSTTYNGNLGGLSGADTKCQERANAVNPKLGGVWKAWLSDANQSPATRFTDTPEYRNDTQFKLLNGTIIANNWADLTDGTLQAGVRVNEFNSLVSGSVWTNTNFNGQSFGGNFNCNNFTSINSNVYALGMVGSNSSWWTAISATASCSNSNHLYCFEQSLNSSPLPTPSPTPTDGYPQKWDYRNFHGENWNTPAKNQGSADNCWAFADIGALETQINLYFNQHLDLDLSEQMLVDCIGSGDLPLSMNYTKYNVCSGNHSLSGGNYCAISVHGISDEQCDPYAARELYNGLCDLNHICGNWQSRVWKTSDFRDFTFNVNPGTVLDPKTTAITSDIELKKILISNGPLTSGYIPWQHAMVLEGYETDSLDGESIWIFKNSWGNSWGEDGYGKFKTDIVNLGWVALPLGPFIPPTGQSVQISCVDKDNDSYCNWGISENKPSTCPASCKPQKDCDDSNSNLAIYDAHYNCSSPPTKMCAQVITPAKNPATGECQVFSTPCNVPQGWERVENCVAPNPNMIKIISTPAPTSYVLSPKLSANTLSVTAGNNITIDWEGITKPTTTDWIGLYKTGADNKQFQPTWVYTSSCTKTAGTQAKSSGSCSIAIPTSQDPGTYEFRLLSNNGYTKITSSNPVEIKSPTSLNINSSSINPGGKITVTWSNIIDPKKLDWVGVYEKSADDKTYKNWVYVSCTKTADSAKASGSCEIQLVDKDNKPLSAGNYNLRLFSDNGYTKLSTSDVFVIQ